MGAKLCLFSELALRGGEGGDGRRELTETPLGIQTARVAQIMQTQSREQECRCVGGGVAPGKAIISLSVAPATPLSLAISLVLSSRCTDADGGYWTSTRPAQLQTVGATEELGPSPTFKVPLSQPRSSSCGESVKKAPWTFLVVQWLRIHLPMQGTQI